MRYLPDHQKPSTELGDQEIWPSGMAPSYLLSHPNVYAVPIFQSVDNPHSLSYGPFSHDGKVSTQFHHRFSKPSRNPLASKDSMQQPETLDVELVMVHWFRAVWTIPLTRQARTISIHP